MSEKKPVTAEILNEFEAYSEEVDACKKAIIFKRWQVNYCGIIIKKFEKGRNLAIRTVIGEYKNFAKSNQTEYIEFADSLLEILTDLNGDTKNNLEKMLSEQKQILNDLTTDLSDYNLKLNEIISEYDIDVNQYSEIVASKNEAENKLHDYLSEVAKELDNYAIKLDIRAIGNERTKKKPTSLESLKPAPKADGQKDTMTQEVTEGTETPTNDTKQNNQENAPTAEDMAQADIFYGL